MRAARRSRLVPTVLCTLLLVVWSPFEPLIAAAGPAPQQAPVVGPELPLQEPVGMGGSPAAAFDGTNHLVAWSNFMGGTTDIAGARVSPAGVSMPTLPTAML